MGAPETKQCGPCQALTNYFSRSITMAATPNRQFNNICVLSGFTYGKHKEFVEAAIVLSVRKCIFIKEKTVILYFKSY